MKAFTENEPELGRTPAYVSRYWRMQTPQACPRCGAMVIHVIAHGMRHDADDRTGTAPE